MPSMLYYTEPLVYLRYLRNDNGTQHGSLLYTNSLVRYSGNDVLCCLIVKNDERYSFAFKRIPSMTYT